MSNTKKCSKCKDLKDHSQFNKNRTKKDGMSTECKLCVRQDGINYRRDHKEDLRISKAKYRVDNKDKVRATLARNYSEHKEERRAQGKDYRESEKGKKAIRATRNKTETKYKNAHRSRRYYSARRHKIVIPDNCQSCGEYKMKLDAHHIDYDLPMDVVFFCRPCHTNWHIKFTPLNRESGIFTKGKR